MKLTNKEIIKNFYIKYGEEKDLINKKELNSICFMINLLGDEFDIIKEIPEIEAYLSNHDSKLTNYLKIINEKLMDIISKNLAVTERKVIKKMNQKTHRVLVFILVIILLIALVAIPFSILNLIYGDKFLNGYGDGIATMLGILDFSLGAFGFVIERFDDMKKNQIHFEAKNAKSTGNADEFINTCQRYGNINHGIQDRGWFHKTTMNIYNNPKEVPHSDLQQNQEKES